MKKLLSLITICMITTLCISIITGCGNTNDTSQPDAGATQESTSEYEENSSTFDYIGMLAGKISKLNDDGTMVIKAYNNYDIKDGQEVVVKYPSDKEDSKYDIGFVENNVKASLKKSNEYTYIPQEGDYVCISYRSGKNGIPDPSSLSSYLDCMNDNTCDYAIDVYAYSNVLKGKVTAIDGDIYHVNISGDLLGEGENECLVDFEGVAESISVDKFLVKGSDEKIKEGDVIYFMTGKADIEKYKNTENKSEYLFTPRRVSKNPDAFNI